MHFSIVYFWKRRHLGCGACFCFNNAVHATFIYRTVALGVEQETSQMVFVDPYTLRYEIHQYMCECFN